MKRWLSVLIIVVALGGLIAWRVRQKQAEAAAQNQQRVARTKMAPVVSVAPVVVRDVLHTFEGVGSVEAPLNVKLSPQVSGRIEYLQVHEGDPVTRGQVLVRIDPSQIQAQVRQREADLAAAQYRLSQAIITQNPTNVQVNTQIQQQVAAYSSAQADYNQTYQNYRAQVVAAKAVATDAQGRVDAANAAIANANAAIASAKANLTNAQVKYNRENDLYKQGFVAAQDVDDAKTTVSVQQGAVDVANGQLNAARAQHDSALAQLSSANQQYSIAVTKGKADIQSAKARLNQAKAALAYARANTAQKPAYEQNIAALRASVASAQAALHDVQAQLGYTVITSSLTGFVTGRYMDPGAMATPGTPILAVQEFKQVWVNVPIPEEVTDKVTNGMPAEARFDALPGRTFNGRIVQLNPSADPASRQFTARVQIDNVQGLIKPGMFAHCTMVTNRTRGAVVVPPEAIQQGPNGSSYVLLVDQDNVAHQIPVTTGDSDANGVQILDGVHPGDKVVTLSSFPIKDGQIVRPAAASPGGHHRR